MTNLLLWCTQSGQTVTDSDWQLLSVPNDSRGLYQPTHQHATTLLSTSVRWDTDGAFSIVDPSTLKMFAWVTQRYIFFESICSMGKTELDQWRFWLDDKRIPNQFFCGDKSWWVEDNQWNFRSFYKLVVASLFGQSSPLPHHLNGVQGQPQTVLCHGQHLPHQTMEALSNSFTNRLRHSRCGRSASADPSSQTPFDCSVLRYNSHRQQTFFTFH